MNVTCSYSMIVIARLTAALFTRGDAEATEFSSGGRRR